MGSTSAKKTTSSSADSKRTKMTETIHASQAGQWAAINACACKGSKKTKDKTSDKRPKTKVKKNGHMTLTHNYQMHHRSMNAISLSLRFYYYLWVSEKVKYARYWISVRWCHIVYVCERTRKLRPKKFLDWGNSWRRYKAAYSWKKTVMIH